MAWVRIPADSEADDELRAALAEVRARRGTVANIVAVHSLKPSTMLAHVALYRDIMFGRSELSRTEREALAVAVSSVNECHY